MKKIIMAGAAMAMLGVTGAAIGASHEDVTKSVKARQSLMQLYAFHLGTLGGMARGNIEYDAETASIAASNLASLAALNQMAMWPMGSDNGSIEGTKALPAIWEDGSDVGDKSAALTEATAELADVAGNDLASLQQAMGPVGGACGACHKAYRQSDN